MLIGNINPVNLKGLRQALFVLHSLELGKDAKAITEKFEGDAPLVEIWTNFLIHNHWVEKIEVDSNGAGYFVTDKGRHRLHRIGFEAA